MSFRTRIGPRPFERRAYVMRGEPAPPVVLREAPRRQQRLCGDLPHRWWPVGRTGQLCLRCSKWLRDADDRTLAGL